MADEIADVAVTLARDGEANLAHALAYIAKMAASPEHVAANHWRMAALERLAEARLLLDQPGLRALAARDSCWLDARRIAAADLGLDGRHPAWPEQLPFALDTLLEKGLEPAVVADRLRSAAEAAAGTCAPQDPAQEASFG